MIYNNITELIGNTPLIRINKINDGNAEILAKLEGYNPGANVKDRVALTMLENAEQKGLLSPGMVIIEPTAGNMGISLAIVAAAKGYQLILTMPETINIKRRRILEALGAKVVLTNARLGMNGAVNKARQLQQELGNAYVPDQFRNTSSIIAHKENTAEEIIRDTDGKFDVLVAGVGTGSTIIGVGEKLKEFNPEIEIVAVEPEGSPVISGGNPGKHQIIGIGAGFVPEIINMDIIKQVITVSDEDAAKMTRLLAREEGIFVGISSGAAFFAALSLSSKSSYSGKRIITIFPDYGERYVSSWIYD